MRLLFFLSLCLLISCSRHTKSNESAIICGQIKELDPNEEKFLRITYSIYGIQSTEYTEVKEDGTFKFEIGLQHPIDYKLLFNNKSVRLYSGPKDSSFIEFTSDNFPDKIIVYGEQQTFNRSFIDYQEVSLDYFRKYYKDIDSVSKISAKSLKEFVIQTKKKNIEFVQKYSYDNNWSQKFSKWALNNMNYEVTHDLIFYRGPKSNSYYNFYNSFEIDNPDAIDSYRYWEYLQGFLVYILNIKNPVAEDSISLPIIGKYIIDNSYGSSKDYLLALSFIWGIETALFSFDELKTGAMDYINLVNNDKIRQYLNSYYSEYIKLLRSENYSSLNPTELNSTIAKIFQNHTGKVIYGKIWADWCGSCIKSMPDFLNLKNELNNVHFILIAIDSDMERINEIISHFGITDNSYFLDEKLSAQLKELFKTKAIPQYFIIDRNGAIIKFHATPPNNYITKEILESI